MVGSGPGEGDGMSSLLLQKPLTGWAEGWLAARGLRPEGCGGRDGGYADDGQPPGG